MNEIGYHKEIAEYALFHHENWDGSGYLKKIDGEKIPLIARIIAVADTFVALINERPHKNRINGYLAMKEIIKNNGKKFDPGVIRALLENVGIYPIGSIVQLNNFLVGKVIDFSSHNIFRPRIQFLKEYTERGIKKYDILDLKKEKKLFIKNIME